jgi:membrane protease YdiL (CAAX protease family)
VQSVVRRYRELGIVVVAGMAMIFYTYLIPPLLTGSALSRVPLISALPGDFPGYAVRFIASFLFLGLFPFAASYILGENPHDLGLRWPEGSISPLLYILLVVFLLVAGVVAAYNPALYRYYPYSRTLLHRVTAGKIGLFFLHSLFYLLFYYLPWEFFFRGFLVFPIVRLSARGTNDITAPVVIALASLQAIPSALLHFHHPFTEVLTALPFGVVLGCLAWRTRSLLPGLLLHFTVGISMDLFILLRFAGVLP